MNLEAIKAGVLGLGLTGVLMPLFLAWMRRLGWGQEIREEGPQDHKVKAGTPTMGGAVFVPAAAVASLSLLGWSLDILVFWALIFGCFLMGLVDDMCAVARKRNLGLKARQKLAIQGTLGLLLGGYFLWSRSEPGFTVPYYGRIEHWAFVLGLSTLVLSACTNAVNLTDGLDGLASGTMVSALLAYALICGAQGRPDLALCCFALVGACLGFMWFNCYPARVFMGDAGSMGLGGALAGLALWTDTPFLLLILGGVFVAEAVSVMMQVTYFKLTKGKRIFRMSPIHHHFTLGGLHEVQVTIRFWLTGAVLAVVALYLHFYGIEDCFSGPILWGEGFLG